MPHTACLSGLGWKVKVQEKRKTTIVTLAKEITRGNLLKKGDSLYYYLMDIKGRKALLVLLDKKPLQDLENVIIK